MKIKPLFLSTFALLSTSNSIASSLYAEAISRYLKENNIEGVYKEFAKWQKEEPNSPNIADTWAWYYYTTAYNQNIKIDSVQPKGVEDYMELIGKDGKNEFIYAEIIINCDSLKKGLDIIDKEIVKHPDCIDLYFTKSDILLTLMEKCSHKSSYTDNLRIHSEKGDNTEDDKFNYLMMKALSHPKIIGDKLVVGNLADDAVKILCQILDRSRNNGNQWFDLYDKKIENGESMMLEKFQSYFLFFLKNAEYDKATVFNDKLLSAYPERFDFRTNKSLISISKKDFSSALTQLEILHKDFPNDDIITINLAEVYIHNGKKKQAEKLFKKMSKSSNPEIEKMAKMRLEKIK